MASLEIPSPVSFSYPWARSLVWMKGVGCDAAYPLRSLLLRFVTLEGAMLNQRYRQHWVEVLCKAGRKAVVLVVTSDGGTVLDAVKAKVPDAVRIVTVRAVRFGTLA